MVTNEAILGSSGLLEDPRDKRMWQNADGKVFKDSYNPITKEVSVVQVNSQRFVDNDVTLLRKDEWIALDTAVQNAFEGRSRLVKDLQARNLVHNLPNGIGSLVFQSQTRSKLSEAVIGMTGLEITDNEQQQFALDTLPMFTIHKELQIPRRMLQASRYKGEGLDTSGAAECGLRLAEKAENFMAGNCEIFTFGGGSAYGYTNYPDRTTVDLTYDWTTATGEQILTDMLAMLTAAQAVDCFGPFACYVAQDIGLHLEEDYKDAVQGTTRSRLLSVEQVDSVLTADYLPDGTVLLVQLNPNTVRLVSGLPPTTVQWDTNGGELIHLRVMMIQVPQLRADFYGKSGIIHGTYTA